MKSIIYLIPITGDVVVSYLVLEANSGIQVVVVEYVPTVVVARKNSKTTRGIGQAVVGAVDDCSSTLAKVSALLVLERSADILRSSNPDAVSVAKC